jgi:hypothetical protein
MWPKVIGVLVLVIQGLGLLGAILSAASLFINYAGMLGPMVGSEAFDAQRVWRTHLLAMYASACLLSLLAFAGAILLLQRRRRGVHLLVLWSLLRVPYAVFAAWVQASAQRDATSNMQALTAARPMPPGFSDAMFWGAFVSTAAFAMALPLFLLIWFVLPGIRRQTRAWH